MKEIEVKILEINKKEVIKKLQKLGAKKVFEGEIEGIVYDTKDNRLHRNKIVLRLRKEGNEYVLATKQRLKMKSKAKIREEIELRFDNFENMQIILKQLGFLPKYFNKKHRITFVLGKVRFDIDSYKKIPTFLEIEAHSEKEIEKAVKLLGYSPNQTNNWAYLDLINYYKNQK